VDLSFEDRFVDLVEEGYDLAIRATRTTSGRADCASPASDAVRDCGSKEYLQRLRCAAITNGIARRGPQSARRRLSAVAVSQDRSPPRRGPRTDLRTKVPPRPPIVLPVAATISIIPRVGTRTGGHRSARAARRYGPDHNSASSTSQECPCIARKTVPGLGKTQAALVAIEQAGSQMLLEVHEVLAGHAVERLKRSAAPIKLPARQFVERPSC